MKKTKTVFYDDTHDYDLLDETRFYLYEDQAEEQEWESLEDVPTEVVYDEIRACHEADWSSFREDLEWLLERDNLYLLTGTCGRWNGPAEGGKFIRTVDDFYSCIGHLDGVCIYDENGHLYVTGYHHDGSDRYEIKRVTKKGAELAYRNYYACDRALHSTIMRNNIYSGLPYMAKRVYGVGI